MSNSAVQRMEVNSLSSPLQISQGMANTYVISLRTFIVIFFFKSAIIFENTLKLF